MKVLVPIKRVVDYHVKVRIKSDQSGVDLSGVKMSINPFDEIALEEAIRLKEMNIATEVVVISLGTRECHETLRTGLALGADRAIHIDSSEELQPYGVAKALAEIVQREDPQLVLMGKQAIDDDCNQTGQLLAGFLNWPQGTFISKLDISGSECKVVREVDGGLETIRMALPAVLTADLRLNEPRYATLPNIMKAKQKPLEEMTASDLGVDLSPRIEVIKVVEPTVRKGGKIVSNVDELLDKLRNEAKVI